MAFYKDMKHKTRQEKRVEAAARGGFEDEGAGYRKGGAQKGRAARSAQGRGGAREQAGRAQEPRRAQGRTGADKPRRAEQARPVAYRQNTAHRSPGGDWQAQGREPQHRARQSNGFRFATGTVSHYTSRGENTVPRPYGEQRQARMAGQERRYEQFRYVPPAAVPEHGEERVHEDAENLLSGRNPIREALKSGRDIEQLLVARGELSGSAREIVQMAKERRVPVKEVDRARLDAITRNHQGMLAFASAYRYSTVEDMLDLAHERGEAPFLILLDGITDPHNLGAIIRTAECAGAHGVIVQERRAVGLTPAAVKASAGAVEYLPVARVTNLTSTIERLKREGIWTYAADMDGEDYADLDLSGPIALVIGAEGEGVSRRVLESCDRTISVPIRGKLDSLNASVAAGVLMYAVLRAR